MNSRQTQKLDPTQSKHRAKHIAQPLLGSNKNKLCFNMPKLLIVIIIFIIIQSYKFIFFMDMEYSSNERVLYIMDKLKLSILILVKLNRVDP